MFATPETTGQQGNQHYYRSQQRRRNAVEKAGRFQNASPDELPLGVLFRQIAVRIRRSWVALRYRFDQLTMGLFRKKLLLKLAALGVGGYVLLFSNRQFLVSTDSGDIGLEGKSILTENKLDGGGSRSIWAPTRKNRSSEPVEKETPARAKAVDNSFDKTAIGNADDKTSRYIERFHNIAIAEMRKFGVPASISLAQGLIESRSGTSELATENNNHFGIKCFAKNCPKGHCTNHTDDSHKDFFRNYKSAWESWRAHSIMISTGRYARLKKYGRDYQKWARGLQNEGYATDKSYASTLISIIERYNLEQFDR